MGINYYNWGFPARHGGSTQMDDWGYPPWVETSIYSRNPKWPFLGQSTTEKPYHFIPINIQWAGLREHLQENFYDPHGKITMVSGYDFPD